MRLLALTLLFLVSLVAHAERPINGWWPTGANIFVGIDTEEQIGPSEGSPYCYDDNHHIGIAGANVPMYRQGNHTVSVNLEHNSCLEEYRDKGTSDRAGLRYEYRMW